jgi:hypothetical protein
LYQNGRQDDEREREREEKYVGRVTEPAGKHWRDRQAAGRRRGVLGSAEDRTV